MNWLLRRLKSAPLNAFPSRFREAVQTITRKGQNHIQKKRLDTSNLSLKLVGVDGFDRRSRSGNTIENKYNFIPATAPDSNSANYHMVKRDSCEASCFFVVGGENLFSSPDTTKKRLDTS
ncbi:MAG: hypothetical protein J6J91_02030, partial [Alistipes sp.]|nr:hypothetical protein [Alistipes sp.]